MNLRSFDGKKVKLVTDDGQVFIGQACDYIPKQDNIPEIASISIGYYEFYENEIKSIELIE